MTSSAAAQSVTLRRRRRAPVAGALLLAALASVAVLHATRTAGATDWNEEVRLAQRRAEANAARVERLRAAETLLQNRPAADLADADSNALAVLRRMSIDPDDAAAGTALALHVADVATYRAHAERETRAAVRLYAAVLDMARDPSPEHVAEVHAVSRDYRAAARLPPFPDVTDATDRDALRARERVVAEEAHLIRTERRAVVRLASALSAARVVKGPQQDEAIARARVALARDAYYVPPLPDEPTVTRLRAFEDELARRAADVDTERRALHRLLGAFERMQRAQEAEARAAQESEAAAGGEPDEGSAAPDLDPLARHEVAAALAVYDVIRGRRMFFTPPESD